MVGSGEHQVALCHSMLEVINSSGLGTEETLEAISLVVTELLCQHVETLDDAERLHLIMSRVIWDVVKDAHNVGATRWGRRMMH